MRSHDINVLDNNELDEMVEQKGFESVAAFEWNNDADHLYMDVGLLPKWVAGTTLGRIAHYEESKAADIEKFVSTPGCSRPMGWGPYQLLEALTRAGRLQIGNYCIRVSF